MSRKVLVIAGVLIVIALITAIYLIKLKQERSSVEEKPSSSQIEPIFYPPLGKTQRVDVGEANQESIRSAINQLIGGKDGVENDDFREITLQDNKNNPIEISKFISAAGIGLNSDIKGVIDDQHFSLFLCRIKEQRQYGIIFYSKNNASSATIKEKMRAWEKNMLVDLNKILFPEIKFSASELERSLNFKDGKYRYAIVTFPGGKEGSINYALLGTPIILSSSFECLDKSVEYLEEDD